MYVTVETITIRYDVTKYGHTRRGKHWTRVETPAKMVEFTKPPATIRPGSFDSIATIIESGKALSVR
jgi:uncharacterized protein (UPF0218 family)